MSKRNLSIIGFLTVLMLLSSCASRKSYVYLNDMEFEKMYDMLPRPEAVVRSNDRLKILVTSTDFPELAAPFNIKLGSVQVREDGSVASMGVYNNEGYLVDIDGNIEFPKLGTLHVDGLKLSDVKELVRSKIVEGGYINDPIVVTELINFQYTVLGATGSNGVYKVDGDRINLIEAIAKAGNIITYSKVVRRRIPLGRRNQNLLPSPTRLSIPRRQTSNNESVLRYFSIMPLQLSRPNPLPLFLR